MPPKMENYEGQKKHVTSCTLVVIKRVNPELLGGLYKGITITIACQETVHLQGVLQH